MKVKEIEKIINNFSPAITGGLTSLVIYIYRYFNSNKQYEYAIPIICGGLCTFCGILILRRVKKEKAKEASTETQAFLKDINKKQCFYSEQMKGFDKGSKAYIKLEEKYLELLDIDATYTANTHKKIDGLNMEIQEADDILAGKIDKLSDSISQS